MKTPIRLSVSEAAKIFGVSTRTIRRALANKQISYIVVHGRYKIAFESLLKWSQSSSTVKKKRDSSGIGQFVEKWRIKNTLYSPNPEGLKKSETEGAEESTNLQDE
jgi:excisionase family DNA binding protein